MVRDAQGSSCRLECFPHARGDGPVDGCVITLTDEFSPRTWGWSGIPRPQTRYLKVFPTHVGMVRMIVANIIQHAGFPHARGDGPRLVQWTGTDEVFSPRTWGWSASVEDIKKRMFVFPTHVGMVRLQL